MNILPFRLNVPAEIILERPEGILVQGRYGDRIMFALVDGRVMYVPPFVATKIQTEGLAAGERFQLCKAQVKKGNRRSIEWTVRRIDPSEPEPETPLERDLRASIEAVTANGNGISHHGSHGDDPPAPTTEALSKPPNRGRPTGTATATTAHMQPVRPPQRPSWSMPSRPRSRPPITPSDTAPNWATSSASMRTP